MCVLVLVQWKSTQFFVSIEMARFAILRALILPPRTDNYAIIENCVIFAFILIDVRHCVCDHWLTFLGGRFITNQTNLVDFSCNTTPSFARHVAGGSRAIWCHCIIDWVGRIKNCGLNFMRYRLLVASPFFFLGKKYCLNHFELLKSRSIPNVW